VTAAQVDQVLSSLGFPAGEGRLVRLVWEAAEGGAVPGGAEGLAGLLTALADARGAGVYLGKDAWYHWGARDLAAFWQLYGAKETSVRPDEASGLLIPAGGYEPDVGQVAGSEEPPGFFVTSTAGALVPADPDSVATFGNLVTFEPLGSGSREAHRDQYEAYEDSWRGLPIAIVGTPGPPAGS
jgi:hypothetical protein